MFHAALPGYPGEVVIDVGGFRDLRESERELLREHLVGRTTGLVCGCGQCAMATISSFDKVSMANVSALPKAAELV